MTSRHYVKQASVIAFVAVVGPRLLAQTTVTGTMVTGVLTRSDTGRPVNRAIVHAALSTAKTSSQIYRAETTWNGAFIFPNLPAGSYRFCVHNLDNYLNPCEWPTANAATPVLVSTSDPKLRLQVDPGRKVHLTVLDPAGVLSTTLAAGRRPDVAVLIVDQSGKVWRRVPAVGTSVAGSYSMLVPKDPSYGFALSSADVTLTSAVGTAIPGLAFVPFATPLTAARQTQFAQMFHIQPEDPAVVINVGGLRP